jgi:shikimate kinase
MPTARTLWLVGMMGSGKTTVGQRVAERFGMPLVDLDDDIVVSAGMSIPEIFAQKGETTFRALEREAVLARAGESCVIACGGGAVLDEANRNAMRESGLVVWLDAPSGVLAGRVGTGEGRPLLAGDPVRRLEEVAAARRHLYEDVAHVRVDASASIEDVSADVEAAWTGS